MGSPYGANEIVPAATYPGFVRGYRAFALCATEKSSKRIGVSVEHCAEHLDQVLHPVFVGIYAHVPGVNVARCAKSGEHQAPVPHGPCSCGFYASHRGFPLEYLGHPVFAVVKATGRILLGDLGFRSEKVEVEALSAGNRQHWIATEAIEQEWDARYTRLHALGRVFNVPTFENPAEMLAAYPPQDLTGLICVPQVDYTTWFPCHTMHIDRGVYELLQGPGGWDFVVKGPDNEVIPVPAFQRRLTLSDGRMKYVIERHDRWLLGTVEPHVDPSIQDLQITAE